MEKWAKNVTRSKEGSKKIGTLGGKMTENKLGMIKKPFWNGKKHLWFFFFFWNLSNFRD